MKSRALAALAAATLSSVPAQAVTFDFENFTPTYVSPAARTGALTSLSDTKGGITMDVSRENGVAFDTVDNSAPGQQGKPAGWGLVSLDPFFDTSASAFIADFSVALSFVSIEMSDYFSDDDMLVLTAFDGLGGTGAVVGSVSIGWPAANGFPATQTVSLTDLAGSIRSIRFIGGGAAFPNSVFYDEINVRAAGAVPEPASWAMMLGGMGLLGGVLRGRRRGRLVVA